MITTDTHYVVYNRANGMYLTSEPFCGFDQGDFEYAEVAGNDIETAKTTLDKYCRTLTCRIADYEKYDDLNEAELTTVAIMKDAELVLIKVWEQKEIVLSPVEGNVL